LAATKELCISQASNTEAGLNCIVSALESCYKPILSVISIGSVSMSSKFS
jgi:hypothetical protein